MIWFGFLLAVTAASLALPMPETKAGSIAATRVVAEVETCFSDWTEAGALVRANKLVSAKDVAKLTRQRFDGRVVKMMLCSIDDRFVYRMFLESGGQISTQVVDAAQPFAE